jgi:hypothetical protein
MLLAVLLAASAQLLPQLDAPVGAQLPASATVRIMRAAEIRADRLEPTEESVKRTAMVREADGTYRTATLIEFY